MPRFLRVNWKGGNAGRDTDLHPADAKWHADEGRCEIVDYVDVLERRARKAADAAPVLEGPKPPAKRGRKPKAQPVESVAQADAPEANEPQSD